MPLLNEYLENSSTWWTYAILAHYSDALKYNENLQHDLRRIMKRISATEFLRYHFYIILKLTARKYWFL